MRDIAVLAAALSKGHLAVSLLDAAAQTLAGLVLSTGDAASGRIKLSLITYPDAFGRHFDHVA